MAGVYETEATARLRGVEELAGLLNVSGNAHARRMILRILRVIPLAFARANVWHALHHPALWYVTSGRVMSPFARYLRYVRLCLGYSRKDLTRMGLDV